MPHIDRFGKSKIKVTSVKVEDELKSGEIQMQIDETIEWLKNSLNGYLSGLLGKTNNEDTQLSAYKSLALFGCWVKPFVVLDSCAEIVEEGCGCQPSDEAKDETFALKG